MYKKKLRLVPFLLVLLLIQSVTVVFAENSEEFAVKILGGEKEVRLSLEDLKAMPAEAQIYEEYIYNSKSGEKTAMVAGVSLAYTLKELLGITAENAEVIFEASDGYSIAPQTLEDIFNEDLKYVLAYEIDGQAIDNDGLENEEIVVYRKVKEKGEFNTVFKLVTKISVGDSIDVTNQKEPEAEVVAPIGKESVEQTTFTDITGEYSFAQNAIERLVEKGIINGVGDGKYAPEQEFTRAQFAKIMVEALGYGQAEYTNGFSDVNVDDWFAPYVESAVANGLFTGYPNNTFKPDQVITRQEIATVVGRGAVMAGVVEEGKIAKFTMSKSNFIDKDLVPGWAAKEVAWLEAQKVFSNIAKEKFEPVKVVNRAEAAVIVYNTLFSK